jgi:RNA polymerase sigma-70 factor (ECF subfamily)
MVSSLEREAIEALIARVAMQDRSAFSELYDATAAKLLGVCLRVLKDRTAAEDAMQDSFIKIWHNADRYAVNGLSPMTWLITIARNTAIDRLRARRAHSPVESQAETLAAGGPTPEGAAVARSEARRIAACLDGMPQDQRQAIRNVYLNGSSYADCASEMGIPLNTIRTWLRRGLQSLRDCLVS